MITIIPGSITFPRNATTTWERTQSKSWKTPDTSTVRIEGKRVSNTAVGGIEIATSNPTPTGPKYFCNFNNNNRSINQTININE